MQKILITLTGLLLAISAQAQNAALLVYEVREMGVDPYISRVLVTDTHVRMDEGAGSTGYTLFDRQQATIFNVSQDDRSVLVIAPTAAAVKTEIVVLDEKVNADADAPKVAGVTPMAVQLLANGEVCQQLVVLPGIMPAALAGLKDLRATLAKVQAASSNQGESLLESACDIASYSQAPLRLYKHGLPLQERSAQRSQMLVDFAAQHEVDAQLFVVPADYRRIYLPGMAPE